MRFLKKPHLLGGKLENSGSQREWVMAKVSRRTCIHWTGEGAWSNEGGLQVEVGRRHWRDAYSSRDHPCHATVTETFDASRRVDPGHVRSRFPPLILAQQGSEPFAASLSGRGRRSSARPTPRGRRSVRRGCATCDARRCTHADVSVAT